MHRVRTHWLNVLVLAALLAVMLPVGASAAPAAQDGCAGNLLYNGGF